MTKEQREKLQDVKDGIKELRNILDCVMYGEPYIDDSDYNRIRKCYDRLCQASDEL